jgi:hypothetical protein
MEYLVKDGNIDLSMQAKCHDDQPFLGITCIELIYRPIRSGTLHFMLYTKTSHLPLGNLLALKLQHSGLHLSLRLPG